MSVDETYVDVIDYDLDGDLDVLRERAAQPSWRNMRSNNPV